MQLQDFCGQMEKQLVAFKESLGKIEARSDPTWIRPGRNFPEVKWVDKMR